MKLSLLLCFSLLASGQQLIESSPFSARHGAPATSDAGSAKGVDSTGLVGVGVDKDTLYSISEAAQIIATPGNGLGTNESAKFRSQHMRLSKPLGKPAPQLVLSQSVFAASQALDLLSCGYGCPEANSLLATNGQMRAKGLSVKIGFAVGVILAERVIMRRWPKARTALIGFNYVVGVSHAGVAMRNWRTR